MAIERRSPWIQAGIFCALLTNMDVHGLNQAIEKVRWFLRRWNIAVFHKVLKSSCDVEKAQTRHADQLMKYIVLISIILWRL